MAQALLYAYERRKPLPPQHLKQEAADSLTDTHLIGGKNVTGSDEGQTELT